MYHETEPPLGQDLILLMNLVDEFGQSLENDPSKQTTEHSRMYIELLRRANLREAPVWDEADGRQIIYIKNKADMPLGVLVREFHNEDDQVIRIFTQTEWDMYLFGVEIRERDAQTLDTEYDFD